MDASELAKTMLEWEQAQTRADELKAQIEAAVMEIGKTQTVGNVKATFYNGRKVYDYKKAIENGVAFGSILPEALHPFVEVVPETTVIHYREACQAMSICADFTQGEPSVTVKLVG